MIGVFPIVIVASAKIPVKTLTEMIAYAKERPDQLNYGSVGIGSSQHLPARISSRSSASSSPTCLIATSRSTRRT